MPPYGASVGEVRPLRAAGAQSATRTGVSALPSNKETAAPEGPPLAVAQHVSDECSKYSPERFRVQEAHPTPGYGGSRFDPALPLGISGRVAPVAQWIEHVSDENRGCRFESCRAHILYLASIHFTPKSKRPQINLAAPGRTTLLPRSHCVLASLNFRKSSILKPLLCIGFF